MPVEVGELIDGKYRVERILGEGGMGVVVAVHHEQLAQRFAVKILRENTDAVLEKRFLREARAAAQFRSDHVARVFDVGALPGGRPYMVMELLDGCDLDKLLQSEGKQPVPLAVTYVLQAMAGLSEAHALRMVHRDIKPGNLFLTRPEGGAPFVKLLDFGISKDGWSGSGRVTRLTRTGAVLGSPHFMAPEQLVSSSDVDPRADIWSLGATLYELVTGEVPFDGKTLGDIYAAILRKQPKPLDELCPGAPPELSRVIARCLQKDVYERYASLADLALDLLPLAPEHKPLVDGIVKRLAGATRPLDEPPPSTLPRAKQAAARPAPVPTQVMEPPPADPLAPTLSDPAAMAELVSAAKDIARSTRSVRAPKRRWWPLALLLLSAVAIGVVVLRGLWW